MYRLRADPFPLIIPTEEKMSTLSFHNVDFHHPSPFAPVFDGLNLAIETTWRAGLVGRNGRGKTTLLRLIERRLVPTSGEVSVPVEPRYFPYRPADESRPVIDVVREAVAPFAEWERRMEALLSLGGEEHLAEYGDLLERFEAFRGYEIDALIEREIAEVGLHADLLDRSFETLSGGERTRALVTALFLRPDVYPLIDEPTNHLDMAGRGMLADYLSRKRGFLLVSHDRDFLDRCVDHIVSINRSGVRVDKGSYSDWKRQMEMEEEHERRKDENLRREIVSLEETARRRRGWSQSREKEKDSAYDSGYEGHKAAKMMKRALHVERRVDALIEEKKDLLGNHEGVRALRLQPADGAPETMLAIQNVRIGIDGRMVVEDFSLTIHRGERVALLGPNGCGKTTVLRAVDGSIRPDSGFVHLPGFLRIARSYQSPLWSDGYLRDHLRAAGIDETRFRQIMGAFGVWGEMFDRPLETFSQGERKKVDLCRSFLSPAHLLVWDEPMNYIDLASREQIEEVIADARPTMLFVEHDRRFVERMATRVVEMTS